MVKKNFYKKNKTYVNIAVIVLAVIVLLVLNNVLRPDYQNVFTPSPLKGDVNAKVQIIEFSDYQCPACKQAYFEVERLLTDYEGKINIEYKHFPLRTIHPYAQKSAEASECANDQGKFWEYTDLLFKNSPALTKSNLKSYASELGLDKSFNACLDSGAKKSVVDSEYNEALRLGLSGTPSFFVNGKQMEWVTGLSLYDNLKVMVDAELEN